MITNIEQSDVQSYVEHVEYFLNFQMLGAILNLPTEQKNRFFSMLEQNADLFLEMFSMHESFVLKHVLGETVDFSQLAPQIQQFLNEYDDWKES
jgi:c-di-AMP phosphodiesterase-like protein